MESVIHGFDRLRSFEKMVRRFRILPVRGHPVDIRQGTASDAQYHGAQLNAGT